MLDSLLHNILTGKVNTGLDFAAHDLMNFSGVILYGAGDLCKMALEILSDESLNIVKIVDRDSNKWGRRLCGISIVSIDEVTEMECNQCLFVDCISKAPFHVIEEYLGTFGVKNIIHFYDVTYLLGERVCMTNGWRYEQLTETDRMNITRVYNALADTISQKYYLMMLYWRIRHEEITFSDIKINMADKYFPADIIVHLLHDHECFLDGGGYTGNTIEHFLKVVDNRFDHIVSYEPDFENFSHLQAYVKGMGALQKKITLRNYGIGGANARRNFINREISSRFLNEISDEASFMSVRKIDSEDCGPITFLKLHLEGMELEALQGGIKTIQKYRPIIALTAYHSEEGVWKIPVYLMQMLSGYRLYYRLHMYEATSSVWYAIPEERYH